MGRGGGGQGRAGGMVTGAGITHWALFLAHVEYPATARSCWAWKTSLLEDQPGVGDSTEGDVPLPHPPEEETDYLGLLHKIAGSASGQTGPNESMNKETNRSCPFPTKTLETNLRTHRPGPR